MTDTSRDTLLQFPCEFPIKAFGLSDAGFPDKVREIVLRHADPATTDSVQCRQSQRGKYDAVTITITATSKAQLDAIYQELTACTDVIMAL